MAAKVVTVTSGKGGVGKTTATANLASALAAENLKVVCIDADIGCQVSGGGGFTDPTLSRGDRHNFCCHLSSLTISLLDSRILPPPVRRSGAPSLVGIYRAVLGLRRSARQSEVGWEKGPRHTPPRLLRLAPPREPYRVSAPIRLHRLLQLSRFP